MVLGFLVEFAVGTANLEVRLVAFAVWSGWTWMFIDRNKGRICIDWADDRIQMP